MATFTKSEIEEYREKQERNAAKAREAINDADTIRRDEESRLAREELEQELEGRFRAAGGTSAEWREERRRIVKEALAARTLADAEPEPDRPRAPRPHALSKYRA